MKVVMRGLELGRWQKQVGEGAGEAMGVGTWGCQGEGVVVGEGEGVEEAVGALGTVPL